MKEDRRLASRLRLSSSSGSTASRPCPRNAPECMHHSVTLSLQLEMPGSPFLTTLSLIHLAPILLPKHFLNPAPQCFASPPPPTAVFTQPPHQPALSFLPPAYDRSARSAFCSLDLTVSHPCSKTSGRWTTKRPLHRNRGHCWWERKLTQPRWWITWYS